MAQPSREQKLKELTDWMYAFGMSVKDACKQLKVTEDILTAVQNGKAMPRHMWNELKSRFDYKKCIATDKKPNNVSSEVKQKNQQPEEVIKVGKEKTVALQKTQMTFSFTIEISSLRQACKKWLEAHPGCKSKDLIGTVEEMLQDMFS